MRPNKIKTLWAEGKTAINAWLTIPSAWSAELMAHAGYDSLTIDLQHGFADYSTALGMLQAISTTDTVPEFAIPVSGSTSTLLPELFAVGSPGTGLLPAQLETYAL